MRALLRRRQAQPQSVRRCYLEWQRRPSRTLAWLMYARTKLVFHRRIVQHSALASSIRRRSALYRASPMLYRLLLLLLLSTSVFGVRANIEDGRPSQIRSGLDIIDEILRSASNISSILFNLLTYFEMVYRLRAEQRPMTLRPDRYTILSRLCKRAK